MAEPGTEVRPLAARPAARGQAFQPRSRILASVRGALSCPGPPRAHSAPESYERCLHFHTHTSPGAQRTEREPCCPHRCGRPVG